MNNKTRHIRRLCHEQEALKLIKDGCDAITGVIIEHKYGYPTILRGLGGYCV